MELLGRISQIRFKSVLWALAALVAAFLIGYFIGRSNETLKTTIKEVTKYVPSKQVYRDTIYQPVPKEVFIRDTVPEFVYTDTTALYKVWRDYYLTRSYNLDFSNDTLGIFRVEAEVEQNKLTSVKSYIRPIIKEVTKETTIIRVPKLQWSVGFGLSPDFKTQKIDLGADIRGRWYIGASGIRMNNETAVTINAGIKF